MPLTLSLARTLAEAAEAEAVAQGITIATTVVDAGGQLLLFARMDGTQLASTVISQGKAYTALAWRRPSGDLWAIAQPGQPAFGVNGIDERFVIAAGGLPLVVDGEVVGGIGVSGGTQPQDLSCAEAAVDALDARV